MPDFTFDHVHLYCTDPGATERWFVSVIGASVTERRGTAERPTVVLDVGGGRIQLRGQLPGEDLAADGPSRFGIDHIGLLVPDVPAAIERLRARGAEVVSPPRELRPGVFVAFVEGPDRIRVELLSR
jgi:catechol 2,3-dioxygenase-like lactoylglutathione lyase family enzyme